MAKNYKTIALTGTEQKVVLAGQNCDIRNDSVDIVYASAESGITSGADGVLSIPAGQAAKLLDCRGTLYILGTGSVMLCGNDYSELVFKTAATSSGEGGGTVDDVARQAISSHANNEGIHLTAEKTIEAAATAISNPNLLDNSWFGKGVINQRGKTEYSGARVYCIDRWRIGSSATIGNCTLTDDGINFATTDETCDFEQTIENYNMIVGKLCTISCGDNLDNVYSLTFTMGEYSRGTLGKFVLYSTSDRHIVFRCPAEENATMKWAKLELGSVATPFAPPNPATELAKCQRYYQLHTTGDIDPIDLRPSMRIAPTVTELADGNYAYSAEL